MRLLQRFLLAILIGGISGILCYLRLAHWQKEAGDFTFTYRAAKYLLQRQNPYDQILPQGEYPFQTYFYYPATAAIASIPFVPFPPYAAGALFFGLSSFLLAFAITAQGWNQLPIFVSAPYIVAMATVQWAPLILAAGLLPPLAWLLACKPNLGFAIFLFKPSWKGVGLISLFIVISLLLLPTWLVDWLQVIRSLAGHPPPILVMPAGPLLLLGIISWRKPEGRTFLGLTFFPQLLFFYDQLPLWLIPKTFSTSLYFSATSWIAYFIWRFWNIDPFTGEMLNQPTQYVMFFLFLPALVMLLWEERSSLATIKKKLHSLISSRTSPQ